MKKNRLVNSIPNIFKDENILEKVLEKTANEILYFETNGLDFDALKTNEKAMLMYLIADEKINDLVQKKSPKLKTLSKRLSESIRFNLNNQYGLSDKDELELLKIVCEEIDEIHFTKLITRVIVSAYFRQKLLCSINAKR